MGKAFTLSTWKMRSSSHTFSKHLSRVSTNTCKKEKKQQRQCHTWDWMLNLAHTNESLHYIRNIVCQKFNRPWLKKKTTFTHNTFVSVHSLSKVSRFFLYVHYFFNNKQCWHSDGRQRKESPDMWQTTTPHPPTK